MLIELLIATAAVAAFGLLVLWFRIARLGNAHRAAAQQAERQARFLAALSRTNRMVLRELKEDELFVETCHICVETGHARLACVYRLEGDQARRVATAGPAAIVLNEVPNPLDIASLEARTTYTAMVLRDGVRRVSNRYRLDPLAGHWREQAVAHEVRAIAWIPLRRAARTYGALMLCADAEDFFDAELLGLLDELGNDISFALDNLDRAAERLSAQREVEAGLERFRRLFEASPMPSAIIAVKDRRIVDVNDAVCSRYGLTREAILGVSTASHAHGMVPDDRELFYQTLESQGRVRNLVVRVRDLRGATHPEVINAELIEYLGEPCCLITSLDLGDLQVASATRKALAEEQAANRAKNDFLSRISHELRTPLHAILGFSAILHRDVGARLAREELDQLRQIERSGKHLLALVDDMLDLSRIESGHVDLTCVPLELAPVLRESISMSRSLADSRHVRIHLELPAADPAEAAHSGPVLVALADRTRLHQVLINLLSNAIKYNRPGGEVWVRAARHEGMLRVEVTDNGIGMTREQQSRLFEPFNRLGREREGIEGTGIGLSLARQLTALMNGEMTATSEPGQGTTLRFTLPACAPLALAHDAKLEAAEPEAPEIAALTPPRAVILYVEDNPVNAILVEELLRPWPQIEVHVAPNAAQGLKLWARLRPTLVLLDMQLPDLDGIEVLRRLRASADAPAATPIVVLSASARPEEVSAATAAGATDYWTKPPDFARFPMDVFRVLRGGLAPAAAGSVRPDPTDWCHRYAEDDE